MKLSPNIIIFLFFMKHLRHILFLSFFLCPVMTLAEKVVDGDIQSTVSSVIQPLSMDYSYIESSPIDMYLSGFRLHADSGSLQHALDVKISLLPYKKGSVMHSNMENVSSSCDGFRLLPNGVHFSESNPALLTLAYDPMRVPKGYKETDIYTYYCEDAKTWHRLERVCL